MNTHLSKLPGKYETYKKPSFINRYWIQLLTIIFGIVLMNSIFLFEKYRDSIEIKTEDFGQVGDFIGGYVGTLFALVSILFLYSTLKDQRESSETEKFENKYFALIELHRNNVSEIGIGKDFGKKIFVLLIREFRVIHSVVKELSTELKIHYSKPDLCRIAYITLFFGVGPNSSRMLKAALRKFDDKLVNQLEFVLSRREFKNKIRSQRGFRFTPFEGHQPRLGHYYRHLYQSITYVDNQKIDIDKYGYIKTIRAQLTTHEQALLFINCLTEMGENWWKKDLLIRYRFVKNIPKDFFDTTNEIDLDSYFPIDYFEWQEKISG